MQRGRIQAKERIIAKSKIIQALKEHPDGLGVRELQAESHISSFETLYIYLRELESENKIAYHEVNIGRGKPKKLYKLTQEGIAYLREFRVIEYFEKIRESCKDEPFELDNYTYSYLVYGIPSKLDEEDKIRVVSILKKINIALMDLENLKDQIVNKEPNKYRKLFSDVRSKIEQYISEMMNIEGPFEFDYELKNEILSYISPEIKEKMKLEDQDNFAILATRGPSFIDEFSLRPENYLLDLLKSVSRLEDDEEEVNSIIEQLAKNNYVDQEAIDRIKNWDAPGEKYTNYEWQKIKEKLDKIPQIREEIRKEKDNLIQSGNFKKSFGINEDKSMIITKDMVGKEKLDEIRRELSEIK